MKLTWLTINCSYSHSSLALPILQQACKHLDRVHWNAVDALNQDDPFEIARQVLDSSPDCVAAPIYIFNRLVVLAALSRIKILNPSIVVIVGGPECLGEGARQLQETSPFIDYICSGEGEEIFPILLNDLLAAPPLPENHLRIAMRPIPMESPVRPTNSPFFRTDKPFVQLETSRGCPFGCQYCTSAETHVRYKDIQTVQEGLLVRKIQRSKYTDEVRHRYL